MTITFVNAGTFSATLGTSSSPNPGLPASLANGDVLVLQVLTRGTGSTINTPSGYTQAATVNRTSSHRMSVFYKVVTNAGAETAPTVTVTVSELIACRLTAWRGCDTTTPLDVATVTGTEDGADTTGTAPSITTVTAGAMVIWCSSNPDDNTTTAASGTTQYSSDTVTGSDGNILLANTLLSSAGASGTNVLTETLNGPDNWNFITLALRPASVAAADPSLQTLFGYKGALEFGFGSGPFTPSPTWIDVTQYLRHGPGVQIQRGRDSEFSATQPGTMTFVLDNRARYFDPDYSAGPYFGKLLPMTPVRWRVRIGSTNYTRFVGFVQSWEQNYVYPAEAVCTVNCVDLFAVLANHQLPSDVYQLAVLGSSPFVYYPLEDDGQLAVDVSNNGGSVTYGSTARTPIPTILPGLTGTTCREMSCGTVPAWFYMLTALNLTVDVVHTLEFWFNPVDFVQNPTAFWYVQAGGNSNQIIVAGQTGQDALLNPVAEIVVSILDATTLVGSITIPITENETHHFVAVLADTFDTFTVFLDGQAQAQIDVTAGVFSDGTRQTFISASVNGPNQEVQLAHLAGYPTALSIPTIQSHYNVGISGGALELASDRLTDIATFLGLVAAGLYDGSAMGSNTYLGVGLGIGGEALTAMQTIIDSEQGRMFVSKTGVLTTQGRCADMGQLTVNAVSQATFSDSGALAYSDLQLSPNTVDLLRNRIEVTLLSGSTETVISGPSKQAYGERTESISTQLADSSAARNLGLSRTRRFATPTTRVQSLAVVPASASDTKLTTVLGLELGYRVTANRTPQGIGSAITKTVAVEGITETWFADSVNFGLYLAPAQAANTAQPWFTLADATLGKIGTSFGNQIPY